MKLCLAAVALLCVLPLIASQSDEEWKNFQIKYGKAYRSAEEPTRRAIWEKTLRTVQKHNEEASKGIHSYFMGENEFSDMTFEEFKQQKLGYLKPQLELNPVYHESSSRRKSDFVDLRARGLVTPVKDQGSCGSCWAFASVAALEGAWANNGNALVELSEQQLVDCAKANQGCKGGWMNPTYEYIRDNGGIQTRSSYPYTNSNGTCKSNGAHNVAYIKGTAFKNIPAKNEDALQTAIEDGYPVSIAVYADENFMKYKSGLYTRANTFFDNLLNLNHAVVIVGYDFTSSDKKQQYYIVKNSWGTSWGEDGYIRLLGNQDTAGMLSKGSYPTV